MIQTLILTMQIFKIIFAQCTYYPQTLWEDALFSSDVVLVEKHNFININQGIKFNRGVWINYRPLDNQNVAAINIDVTSVKYLIYSFQKDQLSNEVFLAFIELNLNDHSIAYNIYLKNKIKQNNKWWQKYKFNIQQYTIDGDWMLFYYYIQDTSLKVYLHSFNQNNYQLQKITWNGQFSNIMYDYAGGFKRSTIDNNQIILNVFPGKLTQLFTTNINIFDNFDSFLQACTPIASCTLETIDIISDNQYFDGNRIVNSVSYGNEKLKNMYIKIIIIKILQNDVSNNQFKISGWVKQDKFRYSQINSQLLLRLTINENYVDDSLIGNKLLYVLYHNNINQNYIGLEIITYSYTMPYQSSDYSLELNQKDLDIKYSELLSQWHFFQFEVGSNLNQGQPIYRIYFPSEANYYQFNWNEDIHYFKNRKIYFHIGGDEIYKYKFQGYLSNWKLEQFCSEFDQTINVPCHYSCLTCKGITDQDCLSCSADNNRIYISQSQSCLCQYEYYEESGDPVCKSYIEQFDIVKLITQEIECYNEGYYQCQESNLLCEYGYFKYNKQCVKCPLNDDPNLQLDCANCLYSPDSFASSLLCAYKYFSSSYDEIFNFDQKYASERQLFQMKKTVENNYYLQILYALTDQICRQGFYLDQNNNCQSCADNCQFCVGPSIFQCFQCFKEYRKSELGPCIKCQHCDYCQTIYNNNQEECRSAIFCKELQYWKDNQCIDCGLYCQTCNEIQCLTCLNSQQYYIRLDRQSCGICSIKNCKYCFEYYFVDPFFYSSFDQITYFGIYQQHQIFIGCAQCYPGYAFSLITKTCEIQQDYILECDSGVYDQDQNFICLKSSQLSSSIQNTDCSDLENCYQCINQYTDAINRFCVVCQSGYYSEWLTGKCIECPSYCKICVQQHGDQNDFWKSDLKAFYSYFLNQIKVNDFEYYGVVQDSLQVYCLECQNNYLLYKNKCYPGCTDECLDCRIIEQLIQPLITAKCFKCKSNQYGPVRSLKNYQCQKCAPFCVLCSDRTNDEIKQINSFFDTSSTYNYFSKKCLLRQEHPNQNINIIPSTYNVINCNNLKKCSKSIVQYYNIHCDQIQSSDPNDSQKRKSITFYFTFILNMLSNEGDPKFFMYLNEQSIQESTYDLQLLCHQDCMQTPGFPSSTSNELRTNVFHLKMVHFKLYSKSQKCSILQSLPFSLNNYNSVTFENILFRSIFYYDLTQQTSVNIIFQINNNYETVTIIFDNCHFTQNKFDYPHTLTITSNRPKNTRLLNLKLYDLKVQQSKVFNLQPTTNTFVSTLIVHNFQLLDSEFEDTSIFYFSALNQNLNYQVFFENVTIINTKFNLNSFFINLEFEKLYQIELIEIKNFHLENVTITNNSSFIKLLSCKNLTIQNITFKNISILDNSASILASNFIINQITLENSFVNESYFISNIQSDTQLLYLSKNLIVFEIYDIRFINNKYSYEKAFIQILNLENYINIVKIQNLLFKNNNYFILEYGTQFITFLSHKQALIYIECSTCYLRDIEIKRGIGYPEISIMRSNDLQIYNLNVEQDIELHNQDRFLHYQFNCIKQYNYMDLYYVLYIWQFHLVSLKHIYLKQITAINFPLILFEGQSLSDEFQQGIITIQDSHFQDNLLITTKLNVYSTIISIKTQQETYIIIENVQFENNWLNKNEDEIQIHSSTTLMIETYQGDIIIRNANFTSNTVTNSQDSIIYIKTQNLTFLNCQFKNQNNLNIDSLNRNILLDITQSQVEDSIKYVFQILSLGGNGYFLVNSLKFQNSSINNSIALQGGGLYIVSTLGGEIQIQNSKFFSTFTNLNGYSISSGGLFYIDARNSKLNFTLDNCTVFRSYSRQDGGAIVILPSRIENYVAFNNVTFTSAFSFQSSLLSYQQNQLSSLQSKIIINNSRFQSNESEFNQYIQQIEELSTQEIQSYQIQNPSIKIQYSDFTLCNSVFDQIHLANLISVTNVYNVRLEDIIVQNCNIFNSALITLSLLNNVQANLLIQNLQIKQINQYNYLSIRPCKNYNDKQLNSLVCPINSLQINYKPQIVFEQIDYTNQLNCNLNMLYSKITNKFALLQLSEFTSSHQINIENLQISDIQCINCYYGLTTIQQFDFQSVNLKLNSLKFQNSSCGQLGCLSIINNFDENILDTSESSRILTQNNVDLLENYVDFNISAKITNSIFYNNQATYGGGCFFANLNIYLDYCNFLSNIAQKYGGGIYFSSKNNKILLANSKIINNTAQIAGGIYMSQDQLLQLKQFNLVLKDNLAEQFSDNVFEQPNQLIFQQKQNISLKNKNLFKNESSIIDQVIISPYSYYGSLTKTNQLLFPSGIPISNYKYFDSNKNSYIPYNLIFRIIASNKFNEKTLNLNGKSCQIYAQKIDSQIELDYNNLNLDEKISLQYLSTNKKEFNIDTGDFNFDDLIIYFNPLQDESNYLQLAIQCKILQIPQYSEKFPYSITSIIRNCILLLKIRTFQCQLGEYLNVQSGGCVECDVSQNQYSVSFNASKCETKDEMKMKNIQPAMIELREGYWRAFYYSNIIEECYHLNLNCLGGWVAGDSSCALGHIGALCEQCDLYDLSGNGHYSQSRKYVCSNCQDMAGNLINIAFVIFWTLFSIFLSVNSTIKMIEEFIQYTKLRTIGKFIVFKSTSTSVLMKVFTNYLQIISSISTFQLSIPNGVTLTFTSVGNPIESMAFSLDCYLFQVSSIPIHYLRLVWGLMMIGLYIFVYMFIHVVLQVFINKQQPNITFVVTTLIYIYIYLSPNLFGGLISLLSYRNISNIDWISANVSYQYKTSQHYRWLIIFVTPAFIIIGIVLPLFFWFVVYHNRSKLDTTKVRRIWGYLYNEYKVDTYYWETIKILSKEFIILVLIYYEDYIAIKAILIFFILHIYGNLTNRYKPYQTGDLNHIDSLQISICKISILLASLIFTSQNFEISEIIFPSYVILALINFAFTLNILSKILFAYFDKLQVQIDSVKGYLSYRFPRIIKSNQICAKLFQNTAEKKQIIRQRYLMIKSYLLAEAKQIIQYKEFQKQINKTNRRTYDLGLYDNFSSSPMNTNKFVRLNTNFNSSRFNFHAKQSSQDN